MNEKLLAAVIYEAHRRSRKIGTLFKDLGGSEKEHWRRVAEAAIQWFGEQAEVFEDTVG